MKYFIGTLLFLHGLIHFAGFLEAFSLMEFKELSLSISRTAGIVWLLAGILILAFVVFYYQKSRYLWLIDFLAGSVSVILIICFWEDAKFGLIPNLFIFGISFLSLGSYNFDRLIQQEISALSINIPSLSDKKVSAEALQGLPLPVQKWLLHSGMVGKPFLQVGKITQEAAMRMKPRQKKWLNAKAIQYSRMDLPAFIWTVNMRMNRFLSFRGRDKFMNGKGEMLIKLNSLFKLVNAKGEKLDEGSMQRYLGEMVWFPSLALSEFISWEAIDKTSARATMNYKGTTGTGTFYFNEAGDFIKFSALRFKDNTEGALRYQWVLKVLDYQTFEGIKVPSEMTATWKLEKEDWTWLRLKIVNIQYNEHVAFET